MGKGHKQAAHGKMVSIVVRAIKVHRKRCELNDNGYYLSPRSFKKFEKTLSREGWGNQHGLHIVSGGHYVVESLKRKFGKGYQNIKQAHPFLYQCHF